MPSKYRFTDVKRGDTFQFTVTCSRSGSPVDVSALTRAYCTVKLRENDGDAAALHQRTLANGGITVVDGPGGVLQVTIPDIGSSLSYETDLWFDVSIVEADGTVSTPAEGTITVTPDITRSA